MAEKNVVDMIAGILLIIGGINWGLAIFGANLVTLIFRVGWLINIVYALVGLSALYMIYGMYFKK